MGGWVAGWLGGWAGEGSLDQQRDGGAGRCKVLAVWRARQRPGVAARAARREVLADARCWQMPGAGAARQRPGSGGRLTLQVGGHRALRERAQELGAVCRGCEWGTRTGAQEEAGTSTLRRQRRQRLPAQGGGWACGADQCTPAAQAWPIHTLTRPVELHAGLGDLLLALQTREAAGAGWPAGGAGWSAASVAQH